MSATKCQQSKDNKPQRQRSQQQEPGQPNSLRQRQAAYLERRKARQGK